jgi:hypothetical protein
MLNVINKFYPNWRENPIQIFRNEGIKAIEEVIKELKYDNWALIARESNRRDVLYWLMDVGKNVKNIWSSIAESAIRNSFTDIISLSMVKCEDKIALNMYTGLYNNNFALDKLIYTQNVDWNVILWEASCKGYFPMTERALKKCNNNCIIETCLRRAAISGHIDIVNLILNYSSIKVDWDVIAKIGGKFGHKELILMALKSRQVIDWYGVSKYLINSNVKHDVKCDILKLIVYSVRSSIDWDDVLGFINP